MVPVVVGETTRLGDRRPQFLQQFRHVLVAHDDPFRSAPVLLGPAGRGDTLW
jgi:hypothetical protein